MFPGPSSNSLATTTPGQSRPSLRHDRSAFEATLDQYTGQLLRDLAILDKDRIDLGHYQKLAAENSIASQQAEDQVYVVHQDEGTVKLDEGLVEGAKLNLDYTDIISPMDGTGRVPQLDAGTDPRLQPADADIVLDRHRPSEWFRRR
jgi:membrane fusion protein, multidrug efflux system